MATLKPEIIDAFYAQRKLPAGSLRTACYAPFSSLYFNTNGDVLACCQNTRFPLGNVERQTLDEIWRGPRTAAMRKALMKDNFAAGCQFCHWQFSVGNFANSFTRNFDRYPVETAVPEWPQLMEFAVSNTCNLECVMCYGFLSSSIRSNREKLPPLPKAYTERFFGELRSYLPHLKYCKFLGGEPFLAAESFRIWDVMHEEGLSIPCHVTTNGTQYSARVEKVLERHPVDLAVSLDAATAETFEAIRINAKFDEVHRNFARFRAYTRQRGRSLSITHCLMRQNWREFGRLLLFADEHDCPVYVNLVREPPECTLYTLPLDELGRIVHELEREGQTLRDQLRQSRAVWDETLADLRRRIEHSEESARAPFDTPYALVVHVRVEDFPPPEQRFGFEAARAELSQWAPGAELRSLAVDADERVAAFGPETSDFFGVPLAEVRGREFQEVLDALAQRHGPYRHTVVCKSARYIDRVVEFAPSGGGVLQLRMYSWPTFNDFGTPQGAEILAASAWVAPDAATPSLTDAAFQVSQWASGGPTLRLDCDRQGAIFAVEGRLEPVVFPLDDLTGHWPEDLIPYDRLKREIIEWMRKPGHEQRLYLWSERGHAPLQLRVTRLARFDDQGAAIGSTWLMAAARCTAQNMQLAEPVVWRQLEQWSPGGARARLEFDRQDALAKTDCEEFCGVPLGSCIGKSAQDLGAVLGEHLGLPEIIDWKRTAEAEDVTLRYITAEGPLFVRSVATPRFDARGGFAGTLRQTAAISVSAQATAQAVSQAMRPWSEWRRDAERFELQTDLEQRLSGPPTGALAGFAGLQAGATLQDLGAQLAVVWGVPRLQFNHQAWHYHEQVWEYAGPTECHVVRSLRYPDFDAQGRCIGWRVTAAVVRLSGEEEAQGDASLTQRMSAWDPQATAWQCDLDLQERVAAVSGGGDWDLSVLQGQPWRSALAGAGQHRFGGQGEEDCVPYNPSITEVTWRYQTPTGLMSLRALRRPRWDGAGRVVGGRVWIGLSQLTPARAAELEAEADRELTAWSPTGARARLEFDRHERLSATDRDEFEGVQLKSLLGKSSGELGAAFSSVLGDPDVTAWRRTSQVEDVTLRHQTERGPLYLRAIGTPRFDAAGNLAGTLRQTAALAIDEAGAAAAAQRALDFWPNWSPDAQTAQFDLSLEGRLVGAAPTLEGMQGLPADATLDEWGILLAKRWGEPQRLFDLETPYYSEQVLEFQSDQTRVVRSLRRPRFDAGGRWVGWRVHTAVCTVPPVASADGDRQLDECLGNLGPETQIHTLDVDQQQRIVVVRGEGAGEWSLAVGQAWPQAVAQAVQRRWGTGGSEEQLTPSNVVHETVWRCKASAGWITVRAVRRPRWDASGRPCGGRVRLAVLPSLRVRAAERMREAQQALTQWSQGAAPLQLIADEAGVIRSVDGAVGPWHGVETGDLVGHPVAELMARLARRWSAPESMLTDGGGPEREPVFQFLTDRGLLLVRTWDSPRFNEQDEPCGGVQLVTAMEMDESMVTAAVRAARVDSPPADNNSLPMEVDTDAAGNITDAELASVAHVPNVQEARTIIDLFAALQSQWGQGRLAKAVETPSFRDLVWEHPCPEGVRMVRVMRWPRFEAGRCVGWRYSAVATIVPPNGQSVSES